MGFVSGKCHSKHRKSKKCQKTAKISDKIFQVGSEKNTFFSNYYILIANNSPMLQEIYIPANKTSHHDVPVIRGAE